MLWNSLQNLSFTLANFLLEPHKVCYCISSLLDNAPNKVRYPKETPLISGQNEDGFRMDVHMVFNSFNKMLSVCYDSILPAQTLFLEHISSVYPHFLQALPTLDLATLIIFDI